MNSEELQEDRKPQIRISDIFCSTFFIIFLVLTACISYLYEIEIKNEYKHRRKSFTTVISKQFDGTAGEHFQLKNYAENSLQYPSSYTHLDTIYIRNNADQEILVKTIYTGQDDYKTERVYCAKAIYSFRGQVIMPPKPCWKNYYNN